MLTLIMTKKVLIGFRIGIHKPTNKLITLIISIVARYHKCGQAICGDICIITHPYIKNNLESIEIANMHLWGNV
jgi:hypothetical protein